MSVVKVSTLPQAHDSPATNRIWTQNAGLGIRASRRRAHTRTLSDLTSCVRPEE
jgi:hypothetical protein